MFRTAESALSKFESLNKVILIEHHPRFDNDTKAQLSKLSNKIYQELHASSSLKDKIIIGKHDLHSYGIGKTYVARYQDMRNNKHDGVHLFGPTGNRDYSKSLIPIFSSLTGILTDTELGNSEGEWQQVQIRGTKQTQNDQFSQNNQTQNRLSPLSQGNF